MSVAMSSRHPKEAFEFIKFYCYSDPGAQIIARNGGVPAFPSDKALAIYKETVTVPGVDYLFKANIGPEQGFTPKYGELNDAYKAEVIDALVNNQSMDQAIQRYIDRRAEILAEPIAAAHPIHRAPLSVPGGWIPELQDGDASYRAAIVNRSRFNREERVAGYLFLLPNFVGFLVFLAAPIFIGFAVSLTNYTGFGWPKFTGFLNYARMLSDSDFLAALRNNVFYSFTSVPLTLAVALLLALMLNTDLFGAGTFKTVFFFPNLTSMVAVGAVWLQIFESTSGPVNQLLMALGVHNPPKWFWGSDTALITIVIVVVWKQAGFYMILFLGGLKSIPSHLYEAARMDGANAWQSFWHITWPMLYPHHVHGDHPGLHRLLPGL